MDTARIEELLRQGIGYKEIASELGVSVVNIRKHARSLKERPVLKRSPWRPWEEDLAKYLLGRGFTFEEVAGRLTGRSAKAIKDKQYHSWRVPLREDVWTSEEEDICKRMLLDAKSYDEVAEAAGRTRNAIKIRNGRVWKIRVPHGNNLLPVEDFFDTWTPQMAYILGFLCSDGNVSLAKGSLCWRQSHDAGKCLLKTILPHVGGNVYGPDKGGAYTLIVYSKRLVNKVIALGVPPAKSLTLQLPNVPDDYCDHFIRGVFDGDGCVRNPASEGEKPRYQLQIASASEPFLSGIRNLLKRLLGINGYLSGIEVCYGFRESEILSEWLWRRKDDSLYFDKKYNRLVELKRLRDKW